ncbi:MAG TPA: ATP-binding protein [Pseudomonadales bacterium]|jgi:two-component system sensor histidine kinase QseC
MTTSLRRFLLLSLSSALVIVIGIAATIGYISSRHEAEELLDGQMAQYAEVLYTNLSKMHQNNALPADQVFDIEPADEADESRRNERYANQFLFQFWDGQQLIVRSNYAPLKALYNNDPGFHHTQYLHRDWRIFVLQGTGQQWLVLAEREQIRQDISEHLTTAAILPLVLGLPILLILVWIVVGYCIRRLSLITHDLQNRNADDLHPISMQHAPRELHSLLNALNHLFARLTAIMDMEKRFTADAAHELRTPISAMKLHIQNALADTPRNSPGIKSLQQADAAANRMTHIVQQLLSLNRGLIQGPANTLVPVDIAALARAVTAEHQPYATDHQQTLRLHAEPAAVQGHADMLQMLLRNLIDNALRYTPDGGTVQVDVRPHAQGACLCVSDSGPGIPESERERVFERFYRLDGDGHQSGQEGCGLGLSIVKRVADYHGATVTLDEDTELHGLRVRVVFKA